MANEEHLHWILISPASMQALDHGRTIEEIVPVEWGLEVGDMIEWECGEYSGNAEVISCQGDMVILKKVT
ncbi:MAG: hypothetical protein V1846_01190 [Candidatus Komeilibacteria bacterium]